VGRPVARRRALRRRGGAGDRRARRSGRARPRCNRRGRAREPERCRPHRDARRLAVHRGRRRRGASARAPSGIASSTRGATGLLAAVAR
jgi:hypothetical protein